MAGAPSRPLQLGHGVAAVETNRQRQGLELGGPASIGPRRRRRGNLRGTGSGPSWTPCFNWATASPPWKRTAGIQTLSEFERLQLGHGVAAVETLPRDEAHLHGVGASIGPRRRRRGNELRWQIDQLNAELQLGHGVAAVETKARTGGRVIDHAASIGPRRRRRGNRRGGKNGTNPSPLQLGHGVAAVETTARSRGSCGGAGFNWATASPPWKRRRRGGRAPRRPRFNWATASPPWKQPDAPSEAETARRASIGPRRRRRGNPPPPSSRPFAACRCFNWATASPPWKLRDRDHAAGPHGRFNWATASPPWKRGWGLMWARGQPCFNWATASPPWKRPSLNRPSWRALASHPSSRPSPELPHGL